MVGQDRQMQVFRIPGQGTKRQKKEIHGGGGVLEGRRRGEKTLHLRRYRI
jgi:hypothetical protein